MINSKGNKLKWIIRGFYILVVVLNVRFLRQIFSDGAMDFYVTLEWTLISSISYSGLFIITTEWAKKYKWISLFLYIPILIVAPLVCSYGTSLGCPTTFFILLAILVIYFPWRNSKSIPDRFLENIQKGFRDIEEGKTLSQEEVEVKMSQLLGK